MKRMIRWALLLCLITVACITVNRQITDPDQGKDKKVWSGISYEKQTRIDARPSASAATLAFDAERAWSGFDDWEPAIAADPGSNYVYQMTTRYNGPKACNGCPFPVIIFRRSSDSGATWDPDQFLVISKKAQNDPEIEVAADGTIYAAWLDSYNPGVKFLKSSDHGSTWSTPIAFTGKGKKPGWSDKPIIAISSSGQHVYIAFNSSDSYVVSSHDYGATFSAAVKTNNDTRYWFHTGGAVANDGTVYFAAVDFSQDYTGDANINVLKSTNGGSSWTTTLVDTSKELPDCDFADGCYFGFLGSSAALAVNGSAVLIAYNAGTVNGAPQNMWVRSSNDGVNWSARTEISSGTSGLHNAFPALTAGPSANDFRLAWQDGTNSAWNTWYTRTTNGGSSWSAPVRLSDQSSGAPYKSAAGYAFPYGDYFEIAADSTGRNHVVWGEGTSYTGPGGTWYTRGQ